MCEEALSAGLQALHEVHKILGQVDILGSPIVLGSNLVSGVTTFIKEPLKARNPKQLARGVGKGSLALVRFTSFGMLEAICQVIPIPLACQFLHIWHASPVLLQHRGPCKNSAALKVIQIRSSAQDLTWVCPSPARA